MRRINKNDLDHWRAHEKDSDLDDTVGSVLSAVERRGDAALREFTKQFDGIKPRHIRVPAGDIRRAVIRSDPHDLEVLDRIGKRIGKFARRQRSQLSDFLEETAPGVRAGQRIVPVRRVGVYVPGGNFPLVSTLLMCVIPAQAAGVREVIVCTPPRFHGAVHPLILAGAQMLGINEVFAVGGAQAIGAMAYGTRTIPGVDMIVGPGNRFVAAAKKRVYGRVGVDFIAGPSEVLIVADRHADPAWIAADLIAQAEHDEDALPLLVTTSSGLPAKVDEEVKRQLKSLSTGDRAGRTISKNGGFIRVGSLDEAAEVANRVAPEHLELHIKQPGRYREKFLNYGTLFVGARSTEALGDYSGGINHALPTNGASRYTGGLSVLSFLKVQTTLEVSRQGLTHIGPDAKKLAEIEGLDGHAHSVVIRM